MEIEGRLDLDGSSILKDGLNIRGIDRLKVEHLESLQDSPEGIYGEDLPWQVWGLMRDKLRATQRVCSEPDLYESIGIARWTCAEIAKQCKENGCGFAVIEAMEMQSEAIAQAGKIPYRSEAQRFLREVAYEVIHGEFVGRL